MLDPIVNFFARIFHWIGRGIGLVIAWILWPFMALGRWWTRKGWILKSVVALIVLAIVALYGYFFYITQFWYGFDPDYVATYQLDKRTVHPGDTDAASGKCGTSAIVEVAADLADFNVNQNRWVPSTLAYKLGFFGVPWRHTPFFDNKAAFQLGINQVLRRTTVELVDTLGRVRGTSQIDQDLQDARSSFAYDETLWYVTMKGFFPAPITPTPTKYREGVRQLRAFNDNLASCQATFDPRADNLLQFLDRVASDIGSTSDILRSQIEASDAGWFDPRADDRFWFAYGQLYAYYGILSAARADFADTFEGRNIVRLWNEAAEQLRAALDMQPLIISNGGESAFIMPSHLATMGFYLLRVRANITEMRGILDR